MAPMHNGCCSICGMRLPVSMVQAVRQCKSIQNCPSCARMLFVESDAPQWVGETPSRAAPRKSGVSRFSDESLMLPDMKAANAPREDIKKVCFDNAKTLYNLPV